VKKTVARLVAADLAGELLRDFRIRSSVLCRSVMGAPWGFAIAGREAGSFHLVLDGEGWLEVDGLPGPIHVKAGDLAVLPRGSAHWVKDTPTSTAPLLTSILDRHEVVDGELRFGGDAGPLTEIVCGVFTLEDRYAAPWVERLPPVVMSTTSSREGGWRHAAAAALRDEARSPTRGGATVANRLLESIVVDALRVELSELAAETGLVDALADHRIARVIASLHDNPDHHWTVERLAAVAAMSRSAFAERFRSLVGQPPARYLTELRLRRAAQLLRSTDDSLAEIARRVGYGSEEALSRAFKHRFGASPSVSRRSASPSTEVGD
jgi:AraC-like DNA-binding protein/quercetin dioxygenase-like cupin family protein